MLDDSLLVGESDRSDRILLSGTSNMFIYQTSADTATKVRHREP